MTTPPISIIQKWQQQKLLLSPKDWCAMVVDDLSAKNNSPANNPLEALREFSAISRADWENIWSSLPMSSLSWAVCTAHVSHLLRALNDRSAPSDLLAINTPESLVASAYALSENPKAIKLIPALLDALDADPDSATKKNKVLFILLSNGLSIPSMHDPRVLTPIWRSLNAADQHAAVVFATNRASGWVRSLVPELNYPKDDPRWADIFNAARKARGHDVLKAVGPYVSQKFLADTLENVYSVGSSDIITNLDTAQLMLSFYAPASDTDNLVPLAMANSFHVQSLLSVLEKSSTISPVPFVEKAVEKWCSLFQHTNEREVSQLTPLLQLTCATADPDALLAFMQRLMARSAPIQPAQATPLNSEKIASCIEIMLTHSSSDMQRRVFSSTFCWLDTPTLRSLRDHLALSDVVSDPSRSRASARM